LTYTTFAHSDLEVSENGTNAWTEAFTVTNTGERTGHEVDQLYTGSTQEDPTRPVRELRGFAKVALDPGDSIREELPLTDRDLCTGDPENHRWSLPANTYTVSVGSSSRDIHLTGEIVTEGNRLVPPLTRHSTIEEWREHTIGGPVLTEVR